MWAAYCQQRTVEKNTLVLNNRRHLLISHNKEIQLSSLQDSYPCGLPLLVVLSCTRNPHKKQNIMHKQAIGPIDQYLTGRCRFARKSTRYPSIRYEISLCKVVHKYQNMPACVVHAVATSLSPVPRISLCRRLAERPLSLSHCLAAVLPGMPAAISEIISCIRQERLISTAKNGYLLS